MPRLSLLDRLSARMLRDPRDRPLLAFAPRAALALPTALAAIGLPLVWPALGWPLLALHLALLLGALERFITWYHDLNHHRLFRPPYGALNALLVHGVGALYGSPPWTYGSHHVLMHHPSNNLWHDVSSTLPYRRDSPRDFLRYYLRFFVCLSPLSRFLRAHYPRRPWLPRAPVLGELGYWALAALTAAWSPVGALAVFLLPALLTRSLLIIGNWGEHAFVDPEDPGNLYRSSTDLHGEAVNARCFNVGYHIGHHVRPGAHFSSLPAWFEEHQARLGAEDAVVFTGLHYPDLWWRLMRGRYDALAERFVQLPGAPARTQPEIVALLRSRVAPVPPPEA